MHAFAWVRAAAVAVVAMMIAFGASAQTVVDRYTLKPGDVIDISVLEDPALGRQALIRPDGKFALPLAGTINAFGRSPEEVARLITRRLRSNFIEPPTVTVALVTVGPALVDPNALEAEEVEDQREVFILGEVGRPGRFTYDPETRLTILEALTIAGGPGPFAALKRIQVREKDGEIETLRTFDYEAILEGGAADLTELADGAIIVVPERGFLE